MTRAASLAVVLLPALALAAPAEAEWHKAERSAASVLIYTLAGSPTTGTSTAGALATRTPATRTGVAAGPAPMLSVECSGGETRVIVHWREPMAGFYGQAVRYTIDGAGTRTEQWRLSTDQENMGHWGGTALALVRRLTGGRSLTVRAISRRGVPMEATFRLANLQQAAAPVARACKW